MPVRKRTLLASRDPATGSLVFHSWCLINTDAGLMTEPFKGILPLTATVIDQIDEENRIDEIRIIDFAQRANEINFGETVPLHSENPEGGRGC